MKASLRIITGLAVLVGCCSWGFYAHYRINRFAVFTLPKGMKGFYEANIAFITEHAVSADKRRYVDSTEAPKHFLDADYYGKNPFAVIPKHYTDAAVKYTADTVIKYGTLPWTITQNYYRLVKAFKTHDTTAILYISANIGHYIADACVPLHLTKNYNGQLTNQTGIHALWESRLPGLFGAHYNYYAGKARYINNPLNEAFRICSSSFKCVDSVLRLERRLNRQFTHDQKYAVVKHGEKYLEDYSEPYALAYQQALKGMVQRRLRLSILSVGNFWFSAWVDAGQPNLNKLIEKQPDISEIKELQKEEAWYRAGKSISLDQIK